MAQDLALAQSHAFSLSRILMVPVTLFKSGDEFGVLPSDELDDEVDLEIVHEYVPAGSHSDPDSPFGGQCRSGVPPASGRPQGKLRRGRVQICTLPSAPLPPLLFAAVAEGAPHLRGIRTGKDGLTAEDKHETP